MVLYMVQRVSTYWNTVEAIATLLIMFESPEPLVRDLLHWVAAEPRRYHDALACWRTSCPRLPIWEDAMQAGLIAPRSSDGVTMLELTAEGRAYLARSRS